MYWTFNFVRIKWQLQLPPYKGSNHFKGIHETLSRPGLSFPLIPWNRLSRRTAKPTKWPDKWRLRSTWTSTLSDQSSLSARRNLGSVATHWVHSEDLSDGVHSEDWSDSADAQADLRLRRAHVSFCLLCLAPAELLCFPFAQNHFLHSLSPKIVFVPLFPSFSDLNSLVPLK